MSPGGTRNVFVRCVDHLLDGVLGTTTAPNGSTWRELANTRGPLVQSANRFARVMWDTNRPLPLVLTRVDEVSSRSAEREGRVRVHTALSNRRAEPRWCVRESIETDESTRRRFGDCWSWGMRRRHCRFTHMHGNESVKRPSGTKYFRGFVIVSDVPIAPVCIHHRVPDRGVVVTWDGWDGVAGFP